MAKRGRRRKSSKTNNGQIVSLSPNAISYSGPSKMVPSKRTPSRDDVVVQLNLIGSVSSSGAGNVASVFDCYSQASSSPDWASYIGLYSEYRILSMDITFSPWNKWNTTAALALAPIFSAEDRQNSTAIASQAEAAQFQTVQIHDPGTRFNRVVRMMGTGEADFTSSATSPNTDDRFFLKLFSSGNSNSIALYDYLSCIMVQFRNRK